jgi:hypothetical protein
LGCTTRALLGVFGGGVSKGWGEERFGLWWLLLVFWDVFCKLKGSGWFASFFVFMGEGEGEGVVMMVNMMVMVMICSEEEEDDEEGRVHFCIF